MKYAQHVNHIASFTKQHEVREPLNASKAHIIKCKCERFGTLGNVIKPSIDQTAKAAPQMSSVLPSRWGR